MEDAIELWLSQLHDLAHVMGIAFELLRVVDFSLALALGQPLTEVDTVLPSLCLFFLLLQP